VDDYHADDDDDDEVSEAGLRSACGRRQLVSDGRDAVRP